MKYLNKRKIISRVFYVYKIIFLMSTCLFYCDKWVLIFILIFTVVQALKINATVGLFIVIICILIILLSIWFFKTSKPLVEDIVEMNREVINKTTISVEESKMFKIFNRRDIEIQNFLKMNKEYKRKEIKLEKKKVLYTMGTHALRNFKEPFILLWGGILVVNGELELELFGIVGSIIGLFI